MKLVYGIVLLVGVPSVVVAFTAVPRPAVRVTTMVLSESAAEEYLAGCLDKWDQVEKELVNLKAEADLSGNELVRTGSFCGDECCFGITVSLSPFHRPIRLQLPIWPKKC